MINIAEENTTFLILDLSGTLIRDLCCSPNDSLDDLVWWYQIWSVGVQAQRRMQVLYIYLILQNYRIHLNSVIANDKRDIFHFSFFQ